MFGRNTTTPPPNGSTGTTSHTPATPQLETPGASSPLTTNNQAAMQKTPQMTKSFGAGTTSMSSVISNDLTIIGQSITIVSQGHVQIDGAVQGNVHGKQVSIGNQGAITGMVMAESVEVRGQLEGSIRSPHVVLHPTARVQGDIHHTTISIAEGAEFDGRVRRPSDTSELTPILDPAAIAANSGVPSPASTNLLAPTPLETQKESPAPAAATQSTASSSIGVPTPPTATSPLAAKTGS